MQLKLRQSQLPSSVGLADASCINKENEIAKNVIKKIDFIAAR